MADELNEITFCDECPYSGEPNGCNRKEGECRAHDYCFDLRDERDALKSENAALRERLEKAVELPCKVGDTIFYVQYFCDYKGCNSTTQQFCCGCKEMIEREKRKEKYVICEKSFALKDFEKIGKKYFTTREAAESRLAELKGGAK